MLLGLLYLSIAGVCGFHAQLLIRRGGPAQRPYAYMLIADMLLALVAFGADRAGERAPIIGAIGAVSMGGFVFLVVLPRLLANLGRRALSADRIRLAMRMLEIRELLQPGLGARQERDYLEAIADVREGRVDKALDSLRHQRGLIENPMARRAIDDRIVLTLLYARRWREAIATYGQRDEGDWALSGQIAAEVVRAHGEIGDLEGAARLLDRLEKSPVAREPALAFVIHRARMVYLAFVGRPGAVEALLTPAGPLGVLPPTVRLHWIGTAKLHAGDREGARQALSAAVRVAGADTRSRELSTERLAEVDALIPEGGPAGLGPTGGAGEPPALVAKRSPAVEELADRVAAPSPPAPATARERQLPRLDSVPLRLVPATVGFILLNVLVALLVAWRLGSTEDLAALVRAGANVKPAVRAGEWWRLPASTLLHVGTLHLVFNMYGLWVLGKLLEQLFGTVRFVALYMLAGIGGAVASVVFGPPGVSAGASGAVFGLLGAVIVELAVRRKQYPERWRKGLLSVLVFLAVLQLGIGMLYPIIDQSAHLGGLVTGGALAAVLAPGTRWGRTRAMTIVAWLLASVSLASLGYAAWGVATHDYRDTLVRAGWTRDTVGGVGIDVPRVWYRLADNAVQDPTIDVNPTLQAEAYEPRASDDVDTLAQLDADNAEAKAKRDEDVDGVSAVPPSIIPPAEWSVRELRVLFDVAKGPRVYREIFYVRRHGQAIQLAFILPEARLAEFAPVVRRILSSARYERTPAPARTDGIH